MPRGRERILDEGKQREVCALVSAGCSLQAAASYVECATNTIRREANRNPDFGRRFREARLQAQLSPLQAMRKAAASHWRAAAWMLERGDPDHFARRPAPAFRPKQAQALRDDIAAILSTEIDNPFLLRRVKKQIEHLIEYSIDGVVSVERTDRQLRAVMRQIDEIEREAEKQDQAAYDVGFRAPLKEPLKEKSTSASSAKSNAKSNGRSERTAPSAPVAPKSGPTNAEQLDPEIAALPVTWGEMKKVLQGLRKGLQDANGKPAGAQSTNGSPATAQSDNGKPAADPAKVPPTDSRPSPNGSPPTS